MLRALASSATCSSLAGVERNAATAACRPATRLWKHPQERTFLGSVAHGRDRTGVITHGIEHEGDFGARDPFAGEIGTNFTDKPLGNSDTLHLNRAPRGMEQIIGLKTKKCAPCEGGNVPKLGEEDVERLRLQVAWKMVQTAKGVQAIQHDYKAKDFKSAMEMLGRIATVAEAEGHHPDLHLVGYNNVEVVLSTHSVGGLTMNDFIMADRINDLDFSELTPKRKARFWA